MLAAVILGALRVMDSALLHLRARIVLCWPPTDSTMADASASATPEWLRHALDSGASSHRRGLQQKRSLYASMVTFFSFVLAEIFN